MLVEHIFVAIRTPVEVYSPTPFFTSVVVFIAAATLPTRGVVAAILGTFVTLSVTTWVRFARVNDFQAEVEATVPLLLAVFMSAVAFIQSRNAERALRIQIEREEELKQARVAASEAYERFELISKNTEDLVLVLGEDYGITFASASLEAVLGTRPEDLLGRSALEPFHGEERTKLEGMLGRLSDRTFEHTDIQLDVPKGESRTFAVAGKRIVVAGEDSIVLSLRDVTEARRLAVALEESRRLESLGRLAGAVAHDFNNFLTIVGGGAEGALQNLEDRFSVRRELELILASVEKSASLTRQLLTFGKRLSQPLAEVDLATVIGDLRPLLEKALPEMIELRVDLPEGRVPILADVTQVEQIIMNLVTNARDAMPSGGTLEIALEVSESVSRDGARRQCALLVVRDSGSGISKETKERIFEPYFTTKPEGKGTGLGLSTVYGIVTRWGGTIQLDSEPGVGTTFVIKTPMLAGAA
jgi:PAS domain S-box-containing protein